MFWWPKWVSETTQVFSGSMLVVVGELARVAYVCYSRVVRGSDAAGTAGGL
jgi:hypothetical protein